jgi:type IV pilus assembly protein PilB
MAKFLVQEEDHRALCQFYHILPAEHPTFYVPQSCDTLVFAEELTALLGFQPIFKELTGEDFLERWQKFVDSDVGTNTSISEFTGDDKDPANLEDALAEGDLLQQVERWLRLGVTRGASDIHFESDSAGVVLRMRVDGTLRTMHQFPAELRQELSACLRAMANLDISEHFRPQDGRLKYSVEGRSVECRVSVLPTKNGESIVLRVLDKCRLFPRLDDLAMPNEIIASVRHIMAMDNGLFLVIGPTSSGKTTSIYAALQEINREDVKLLTIEDPIEYELDGILQGSVDFAVGRTFPLVLRSFLRHDPDKILVGEIRDPETAQTALQAALTGHLVLTTLHTATVEEALYRLEEMGLDPFLLSRCLRGILSQRLLRLNCPNCAEICANTAVAEAGSPKIFAKIPREHFKEGRGCKKCENLGYLGRQAVFELLVITDAEREILATSEFSKLTPSPSLVTQALDWVDSGILSPAEFLRQIPC